MIGSRWNAPGGRRRTPSGFTLIEALVVIGIIGILTSLSLPAVQSAREAARRFQCLSNARQLAAAMHQYESVEGVFPSYRLIGIASHGFVGISYRNICFSSLVTILPYLEQSTLAAALNIDVPHCVLTDVVRIGINTTALRTSVASYPCPSDGLNRPDPFGMTNHRGNLGLGTWRKETGLTGFFLPYGTNAAEVSDGLSQTVMLSERLVGGPLPGDFLIGRDLISTITQPVNVEADSIDGWLRHCVGNPRQVDPSLRLTRAGETWSIGQIAYWTFTMMLPPNSEVPDCPDFLSGGHVAARSLHRGGVNVAMGDGSARFVGNGIAVSVWRALSTRRGGEVFDLND